MPKIDKVGIRVDYEDTKVIMKVMDGKVEKDRAGFDFSALPDLIQAQVSLYGLNKVLQDRTSDEKDKEAKLYAMDGVYSQLMDGVWKKDRVGGAPTVRIEVEALAELKGVSVSAVQKALKDYTPEQKDQIFANPALVEIVARLRSEREEESPSLDDLLS